MRALIIFFATGIYSGYAPIAPGTAGSVVGLVVVWLVFGPLWIHSPALCLMVFAIAFAIACWISDRAEKIFDNHDDSRIVIDEVLGMAATMFGNPITFGWLMLGFLLFRVADVIKPWPASLIDRRMRNGAGVMLDDLAAAIYANIVLQRDRAPALKVHARKEFPMIQNAVILSTGDEITTGKVVDTNANYLADKLAEIGIDLVAVLTVGDVPDRLEWAWRTAIEKGDVVISTGGIGPTADDLTTETIARVAGVKLRRDEAAVDHMKRLFASIGRPMPENNLKQADFPEGATIIQNPLGTAPGFRMPVTLGGHTAHLIVLPGVPREMKPMMENTVIPWIAANRGTDKVYAVKIFQTFGMSESALDEAVAGLIKPEEAKVSFRASFPQISLKIRVEGATRRSRSQARRSCRIACARKSRSSFTPKATPRWKKSSAACCIEKKLTLAVAESCTGGLIGHRITNVPGCSQYFKGDLVTYSYDVKEGVLGVSAETLKAHGAVSEECVREMAAGVRQRTGASVSVATSGIAGPDGGTPDKPVGTVCIALSADDQSFTRRYQFRGTRDWIKLITSQVALDWLRRYALGLPIADSTLFRR